MIMSVYLWHMTALIALTGLAMAAGGIGLTLEPGTGPWWLFRLIWLPAMALVLIPFLLIFMRFENGSRFPGRDFPGPTPAMLGALLTCVGLVTMALQGLASQGPLGVNFLATALVVGGVALSTYGAAAKSAKPPAH